MLDELLQVGRRILVFSQCTRWYPAVEDQAIDRAHRIGQDKPVFIYKLITEGTVEARMLELQERKRALAAGVVEARDAAGPLLDAEDLERLFAPLPA